MSEPATEAAQDGSTDDADALSAALHEAQSSGGTVVLKPEKGLIHEDDWDPERAKETIKKQSATNATLRAELKEAKAKAEKFDQAEAEKLSEQEKLAKRAEEAEQKVAQAQQKLRQANLIAELSKPEHGIVNAGAAAKLIEGIEYGEDDSPANLDTLLPDFLEANAFLRGEVKPAAPPRVDGGAGRTTGPTPALTAEELEAARNAGMSPDRYAALKDVENVDEFQKLQQREAVAAAQQ